MLCDSYTPLCWSVCPSVCPSHFTFFRFLRSLPQCSCPNDQVTSKTALAHPHATGVAVYPALFMFVRGVTLFTCIFRCFIVIDWLTRHLPAGSLPRESWYRYHTALRIYYLSVTPFHFPPLILHVDLSLFYSGVELGKFISDYRSFMGELPPFKKLGYTDLDDLLWAMPDVVTVQRGYDECILKVRAVPCFCCCCLKRLNRDQCYC